MKDYFDLACKLARSQGRAFRPDVDAPRDGLLRVVVEIENLHGLLDRGEVSMADTQTRRLAHVLAERLRVESDAACRHLLRRSLSGRTETLAEKCLQRQPNGGVLCRICEGLMVRRNRHGGTPETGLVVLVCPDCGHEEDTL